MGEKNGSMSIVGVEQKKKNLCLRRGSSSSIAEEIGVVEKTLYSPYVKEYLLRYKEFNPALEGSEPQTLEIFIYYSQYYSRKC